MSERRGLLPWPSDDICDIVNRERPSYRYNTAQFMLLGQHNYVVASGLERTTGFFTKEFNAFCGEMHMFAGVQTFRLLYLTAQALHRELPKALPSTVEVFEHSLEQPDDYIRKTYERLRDDNPPIHGHLHELCKNPSVKKHGPQASRAVQSGGVFVYSIFELQAEADKLAEEFKQ